MRPRTLPFAGALLAISLATSPARGQEPSPPFLTVNGNGQVAIEPDHAFVRLGVETEAASAQDAQLQTNRIANAILSAVRDLGIGSEALQTSRLRLSPVYERSVPGRDDREPRVVGYRATNTVSVELLDLTRIGPVIDAGIEAGANRIEGVDLGLSDDSEARRLALAAAVEDARAKAETITSTLGVGLGPVLEVIDHGISIPSMALRDAGGFMALQESTPVATGRITVSASLMIRYRINSGADPDRGP